MGSELKNMLWELLKIETLTTDEKTKEEIRKVIQQAKQIIREQKNDC